MDIGTEDAPYVIEPITEPVPNKEPAPAPKEPTPVEDPELIPA